MANNSWIRSYFWKGGCDIHHNVFSNAPSNDPFSVLIAEDRKEFGTNDDTHAKGMGLIIVLITVLVGGILARPLAWKVLHAIPMKNVGTKTWILIWIYWNHPKIMSSLLKWRLHWQDHFPFKQKNIYIWENSHLPRYFLWWKVGESAK